MNIFDFTNDISYHKKGFEKDEIEKDYNPYVTISVFSNYPDTILLANELNILKVQPSKENHFKFLFHIVRKKQRYSKSSKKEVQNFEDANLVSEYYNVSLERSVEYLKILKEEEVKQIKEYLNSRNGLLK